MSPIEESLNSILPVMINIFSVIGITVFLASILIGIYKIVKKENGKTIIMQGSFGGIAIWVGALLINFMFHFDPFSNTRIGIFISAIIAVIVFGIFAIIHKQTGKQ